MGHLELGRELRGLDGGCSEANSFEGKKVTY